MNCSLARSARVAIADVRALVELRERRQEVRGRFESAARAHKVDHAPRVVICSRHRPLGARARAETPVHALQHGQHDRPLAAYGLPQ